MTIRIGQNNATFHVTLLGHPSSGKTTFLALLAGEARQVEPPEAAQALKRLLEQLRQGKPVPWTKAGSEAERKYTFLLDRLELEALEECRLEIHDFAGECTEELVKRFREMRKPEQSSTELLDQSLNRSDAVIIFADCHAIAAHGGWEAWFNEHLKPLLQHISDTLSQTRRHPVLLLLSRADLVEESFAAELERQALETLGNYALQADVMRFFAFRNRKHTPPPPQPDVLETDYLTPESDHLDSTPSVRDVVQQALALRHRAKQTAFRLSWAAGMVALVIVAVFLSFLWLQPSGQSVTPKDVLALFKRLPEVKALTDEEEAQRLAEQIHPAVYVWPRSNPADAPVPWVRMARHWFEKFPPKDHPETNQALSIYLDRLIRELHGNPEKKQKGLYDQLRYSPKGKTWEPKKTDRVIRLYEEELRRYDEEAYSQCVQQRLELLDAQWQREPTLEAEELIAFAAEYKNLKAPVPNALTRKIGTLVKNRFVASCAQLFREHLGGNYRELYEEKLPRAVQRELQLKPYLPQDVLKQLERVLNYLQKLKNLRELHLVLRGLEIKRPKPDSAADNELGIQISVIPRQGSDDREPMYYYIPDRELEESQPVRVQKQNVPRDPSDWPGNFPKQDGSIRFEVLLQFAWSYGDEIDIWCHDFEYENESMARWNSRTGLANKNYDLPGLTFLIFYVAHADWQPGDPSDDWSAYQFRLRVDLERGHGPLLQVPALLLEANKKRKEREGP